jgi:hypothetical protein
MIKIAGGIFIKSAAELSQVIREGRTLLSGNLSKALGKKPLSSLNSNAEQLRKFQDSIPEAGRRNPALMMHPWFNTPPYYQTEVRRNALDTLKPEGGTFDEFYAARHPQGSPFRLR